MRSSNAWAIGGCRFGLTRFRREPNSINTYDDGRGLYFDDPNGHLLEIITRPYGSGGREAKNPNPLFFGKG
jgi:hypothetical protein